VNLHKAIQLRLIRKAVETVKGELRRIGFRHTLAVLRLAEQEHPSKVLNLPGGLAVRRNYQQIIFERRRKEPVNFLYDVSSLAPVKLTEVDRVISFELINPSEVVNKKGDNNVVYLDYDKLPLPLAIRSVRAGDRFRPLGMEGFKKLKDFFMDCKITRARRKSIPILVAGHEIAWIAGLRIDDRVKLTNATKRVLRVEINPPLNLWKTALCHAR
jgi:tRNA(Ile)-lysidine synthase